MQFSTPRVAAILSARLDSFSFSPFTITTSQHILWVMWLCMVERIIFSWSCCMCVSFSVTSPVWWSYMNDSVAVNSPTPVCHLLSFMKSFNASCIALERLA